jgi:uracil-DNA glycosylase family 4
MPTTEKRLLDHLTALNLKITACRRCPRLVRHRKDVALKPPRRYAGQRYWAKPLTSFGDPNALVLIVGLAPAAHGGNRTGRMFTGDGSAEWLARALYESGFASQPTSSHREDGFTLRDALITAAVRCAPPENKPTREEFARCQPFLEEELRRLTRVRVVVALGKIAWDAYVRARRAVEQPLPKRKPTFSHGAEVVLPDGTLLMASYHPSQQNTFTGKLTFPMLLRVFQHARRALDKYTEPRDELPASQAGSEPGFTPCERAK